MIFYYEINKIGSVSSQMTTLDDPQMTTPDDNPDDNPSNDNRDDDPQMTTPLDNPDDNPQMTIPR
jgi:hypothetical protein